MLHVLFCAETLVTETAFEWLLFGMHPHVDLQGGFRGEHFVTDRADWIRS